MKTGKRFLLAALCGLTFAVPALATSVYGIAAANRLVVFDTEGSGTLMGNVGITGLGAGQSLVGIDFRAANSVLYGVSSDSRLYSINRSTGVASVIGAASAFLLSGSSFGLDFNPVVDRLRLTSDADQNLRLNPNNGTLNTIGSLGFDTTDPVGFDIFAFGNQAFASLTGAGGTSRLLTINLATGAATQIGAIGEGLLIADIAVQQLPEPGTVGLVLAALLGVTASRRQRRLK